MEATAANKSRFGATLWALSIQYYIVQLAVAAAWAKGNGYSWSNNTISDLANTRCGQYGARFVCSPQHTVMNISFVVLGITMVGGAYLLREQFGVKRTLNFGFGCIALAGVGTILVGLFPENTVSGLHILGAALPFTAGNLGMVVLGLNLKLPGWLRGYTILSGVVGLIALVSFLTNNYLGIGIGGMERFVGYPLSIWLTVFGANLLLRPRSLTTE